MVVPNNPWPGYVTSRAGQDKWLGEKRLEIPTVNPTGDGEDPSQSANKYPPSTHDRTKKEDLIQIQSEEKNGMCVFVFDCIYLKWKRVSLCIIGALNTNRKDPGVFRRSGETERTGSDSWALRAGLECGAMPKPGEVGYPPPSCSRAQSSTGWTQNSVKKKESPTASCSLFSCSSRSRDAFKSRGAWRRLAAGVWALLQRASRVFEVTSCGGPVYLSSRSPPHSLSSFFSFLFVLSPSVKEDVPPLHPRFHHPPRRYNLTWWGLCSLGIKTWGRELVFWRGIWWSRISWGIHPFNPIFSWKSDVYRE